MKRKAPTNKERDQVIVQVIDKVFQHETILGLILEHNKKLNKYVRDEMVKIGQSRSENKEGT